MILGSPLYSQALSNISTPLAAKMDKISSDCSRQVTGLSSGLFITLEPFSEEHFVLLVAYLMVKKSLLPNIKVIVSRPSMLELL
jgi:hypothetical protein